MDNENKDDGLVPNNVERNSKSPIKDNVLDDMPPQIQKVMEMGLSFQRFSGNFPNPIHEKITENHITKVLELNEKDMDNDFKDSQSSKKYLITFYFGSLAFLAFLIFFLTDKNSTLLMNILEKVLIFLGGGGAGFGVKSYMEAKKNQS